jgi:hypothetical protein
VGKSGKGEAGTMKTLGGGHWANSSYIGGVFGPKVAMYTEEYQVNTSVIMMIVKTLAILVGIFITTYMIAAIVAYYFEFKVFIAFVLGFIAAAILLQKGDREAVK